MNLAQAKEIVNCSWPDSQSMQRKFDAMYWLIAEVERLQGNDKLMFETNVRLSLDVERLTAERNLFRKETVVLVRETLRFKSVLKEVSGCHSEHDTPKLCDGCLISISGVLDDDESAEAVRG